MEKITIQNFGPVSEAAVALADINAFTGTNSTGKSTTAKLFCLFNDHWFLTDISQIRFHRLLIDYNIDFELHPDTMIRYESDDLYIEITNRAISTNIEGTDRTKDGNSIFIPAERMLFASVSESIFSLISTGTALPKRLLDFGAQFERARNALKKWRIEFLDIYYEYSGSADYLKFPDGLRIRLSQASSGLQSMIPMILVIQFNTERNEALKRLFVIEEPELNVHPVLQEKLLEFIITRMNLSGSRIILTTHSPSTIDALENHLDTPDKVVSYHDFNLSKTSLPK